jgi:hypothetical protein
MLALTLLLARGFAALQPKPRWLLLLPALVALDAVQSLRLLHLLLLPAHTAAAAAVLRRLLLVDCDFAALQPQPLRLLLLPALALAAAVAAAFSRFRCGWYCCLFSLSLLFSRYGCCCFYRLTISPLQLQLLCCGGCLCCLLSLSLSVLSCCGR